MKIPPPLAGQGDRETVEGGLNPQSICRMNSFTGSDFVALVS
ncbi:hypothetical protein [Coraliomargarita parva]|nr:hypothetical protein [Coraliomargarita parva]